MTVTSAAIIRPADASDRPGIRALIDVEEDKLTGWLSAGELFVAAARDAVVGAVRLGRLADDEWWLDSLCVHPDYRGQGIGRLLHHHAVQQAEACRSGVIRFCADIQNAGMHRLAAEAHFSQVGRYALYQAGSFTDARKAAEFRLTDAAAIRIFLDASPYYAHAQRSFEEARTWYFLSGQRLRALIDAGRVYTWSNPASLDGVIIVNTQLDSGVLDIAYLDAAVGSLAVMAQAVRSLGAALGCERVRQRLLARPERLVAIEQAGWRRPAEGEEDYLYSRPLDIDRFVDP